ncbi:MAG: hypothetical protein LBT15_07705 [Synergistaceae bacterium]|nr:hypothetical protein [Synergistaceae bacterium]
MLLIVLFALALTGTCTLLYAFAMPRLAFDFAPRESLTAAIEQGQDSARAYEADNRASASGLGRITEDSPQGRLLARRAALMDARRNLLVLRKKILEGPQSDVRSVSGRLVAPSQKIQSERVEGNLYRLEIEVRLDELLRTDLDETFFLSQ